MSLAISLWLLAVGQAGAQQICSGCDCTHFPVKSNCEKCCSVATGTITSAKSYSVTIKETTKTTDNIKTFVITPTTKRNSDLKEGEPATIFFSHGGNTADRVEVVSRLDNLLVPADEPDPPIPPQCQIPLNALKVFLGDSVGYTTSNEVSVLTLGDTEVLSLRRTSNGIATNAKTFSEDGRIIAEVIDFI
jgi:hypothetical protein